MKAKKPKISIIVPSFNQGQYIEQTIRSVIDQDYFDKELIIIDGGSSDETLAVIKKHENNIAHWVSEKDEGQAHAINKGLQVATGDIFNWLNSDDYLEPGALQQVALAFQTTPDIQVVCGHTHCYFEETGQTSHTYRMGLQKTATNTLLHIEMNQPGTYYRMDVIRSLGGINPSLRYVIDDELWMRYLCKYGHENVQLIDPLLAHFRLHGSSKTVGEGYEHFLKERMAVYAWLAKQSNIRGSIVSKIEAEAVDYYQKRCWSIEFLARNKFIAHFAAKYLYTFYKEFDYGSATYSMKKTIRHGYWEWSFRYVGLFLKLFVLNRKLLNYLRGSKAFAH